MTVSVLIVNWNSLDYLRKCIRSIYLTCADVRPQVVVVDGGSFDGCGEMLAVDFPDVVFVQSKANIGFGRCNNLGFHHVTGEALLLLNPDTELRTNALRLMLEQLNKLPQPGIIGPRLLNTDGSLQTSCVRALPTPLNRALDSEFLRRVFPQSKLWGTAEAYATDSPISVEAISGACMLLRSSVFKQVGGFTPAFFMYGEDMDLCAKVGRLGLKIYYIPTAEVLHHGGGSSNSQISEFSTIMMRRAGDIYMRINHGVITATWYRILQAASALVRLILVISAWTFLRTTRRNAANLTIKNWWYVLKWTIGRDKIGSLYLSNDVPESNGKLQ